MAIKAVSLVHEDTPYDAIMSRDLLGALHGNQWGYKRLPQLNTSGSFNPDQINGDQMPKGQGSFSPIARFTMRNGGMGLVLHITAKTGIGIPSSFPNGYQMHGIISLYKSSHDREWTLGEGHDDYAFKGTSLRAQMVALCSLQANVDELHRTSYKPKYCTEGQPNTCCHPLVLAASKNGSQGRVHDFVCDVLKGEDPYFKIVNPENVVQVEPSEDEKEEKLDLFEDFDGRGSEASASCWERFCAAIGAFFSALCCWCCENEGDEYVAD